MSFVFSFWLVFTYHYAFSGSLSRSAAEQSLTAWRSLGDGAGRAGAAASLLSLGHLVLQLHGVGAGIEEARCGCLRDIYWLGVVVPTT